MHIYIGTLCASHGCHVPRYTANSSLGGKVNLLTTSGNGGLRAADVGGATEAGPPAAGLSAADMGAGAPAGAFIEGLNALEVIGRAVPTGGWDTPDAAPGGLRAADMGGGRERLKGAPDVTGGAALAAAPAKYASSKPVAGGCKGLLADEAVGTCGTGRLEEAAGAGSDDAMLWGPGRGISRLKGAAC